MQTWKHRARSEWVALGESPALEVDGGGSAVVDLHELIVPLTAGGVVVDLVDVNVEIAPPTGCRDGQDPRQSARKNALLKIHCIASL